MNMKKEVILFENKQDCCGCGACANICPKQAIELQADAFGFPYPVIDDDKCVGCGLCKEACGFQKPNEAPVSSAAYAVQANNDDLLEKSASGGVFAMLAQEILTQGGAVVGCAWDMSHGVLTPCHIMIESSAELSRLQGSKYVQSRTGDIFKQVKTALESGRQVLFSGTPCQVDGLKSFLRGKSYPNLLTVDVICHGTPNEQMFADYIRALEKKLKGTVLDFRFRDKSKGWGLNGSVTYRDQDGKVRTEILPAGKSSYYSLFLASETYRESCYRCPYACLQRTGDLTLGDFWGIEKQHPNALTENGGDLSVGKGISCVLVNTEWGRAWLHTLGAEANMLSSRPEAVIADNMQLKHPSVPGKQRDKILNMYRKKGYSAVDRWFSLYRFKRRARRKLQKIFSR